MKIQKYIDILILIITIMIFIFFNKLYLIVPIILLTLFLRVVNIYKNKGGKLQLFFSIVVFILMLLTLILNSYLFTIFTTMFTGIVFLILLIIDIRISKKKNHTKSQKLIRGIGLVGLTVLILGYVSLSYNSLFPDSLTRSTQYIFPGKVVANKSVEKNKDGSFYYKNLTYPSKYKNNKMDIYTSKNAKGTIFYVHGGGYAFGDKSEREEFLFRYVKAGYNVINVNYQLTPDIRYPETLEQVNDALTFITENAKDYNINLNKMVFSGDSAGGQLTGQLINIMNNKEYAEEVGVKPANSDIHFKPKGYIAMGALTKPTHIANTDFFLTEWFFDTLGRSYFNTTDVLHSNKAKQASVIDHVTKDFPSTFISDGNFGTFTKDSKDFQGRLDELNVPVESQFYSQSEEKLFHVYELDVNNKYAKKIYQKHVEFLDNLFEK